MSPTELRYIIAVARERHFGKAAQTCNVTQPTLSLGIKKLEEELNITLFERNHKEISITLAGQKIVEQAIRAVREIDAIKELASSLNNPLALPVRIGAIYTIGPYLFPRLIPKLRKTVPDLPLLIEENYTVNLISRLHHGDIDIAILSLPFEEPGLESFTVYEEPFAVLLPSTHKLVDYSEISIEQLEGNTVLLLGPKHCFRDQVLEICPNCINGSSTKVDMQLALEGSSLETIRYMVASGVGISILPVSAACADNYSRDFIEVRSFKGIKPKRRVAVAWRQGFPRMKTVSMIVEAIRSCEMKCVEMTQTKFISESGTMMKTFGRIFENA